MQLHQNIKIRLVFMIVLGIHCNTFIVTLSSIRLKTCRFNGILFFTRQNVRAPKIGCASEVLCARAPDVAVYQTRKLNEFTNGRRSAIFNITFFNKVAAKNVVCSLFSNVYI